MVGYFSSLFGKPIDAITEQDLVDYFATPQQESNAIEYKSYDKRDTAKEAEKIGKIVRSVAAMLNSGGGIIIWGAPQPVKDVATGEHIVTGNLAPVDFSIGKDRFMGIVFSNISPSPKGIRFEPVAMTGDNFVYLVEVQPSDYPPHQYDGRYYARFDSLSKPAPHHFVEALIKQVRPAAVQGFLEISSSLEGRNFVVASAVMTLFNSSRHNPATNLSYEIRVIKGELFIEDDTSKVDIGEQKAVLKAESPRTLLNNLPVYRKFLVYAPVRYSRFENECTIDMIFWADNVPLCISRYRVTHCVRNEVNNLLKVEPVFVNKPAFEIASEDGISEQAMDQMLRDKAINAFSKEYYRSPLGKKLLE